MRELIGQISTYCIPNGKCITFLNGSIYFDFKSSTIKTMRCKLIDCYYLLICSGYIYLSS